MKSFQLAIFTISRLSAAVACLVLVAMVAHILYEIILRTFFASSTFVLAEFVGYEVAACTFLALGYSFEHGSLIRVSLLVGRLKGRARRVLEVFCTLTTLWIISVLTWYFGLTVWRSWVRERVSSSIAEVPLWIPELGVLVGLVVLWLQLLAYLLRQFTGDPSPVVLHGTDPQHDF